MISQSVRQKHSVIISDNSIIFNALCDNTSLLVQLFNSDDTESINNIRNPSWNTKKTKPLAHAGYKVPGYVLGVPQI